MPDEPKGTTLKDLDEQICLAGMPVSTKSGKKQTILTRRIAIVQALETHSETEDKFKAFDLGMQFNSANGELSIDSKESEMIKSALEKAWPQPGVYVPLCRWLEGG